MGTGKVPREYDPKRVAMDKLKEARVAKRTARRKGVEALAEDGTPIPRAVPKTVESKRVFTDDQIMDEEALAAMASSDEFASFFVDGQAPKILVTTTKRPTEETATFADELADLFPTATYRERPPKALISDIVASANGAAYTHLVVVNESRKALDTLSIVKLPEGPTAIFQLTSVVPSKAIHNHGRATCHTPELILNNFATRVGHRVGRLFISLFPHVPQFEGRQVVTFHNQRDFIFVRRHRYIFEGTKRTRLQEIGPQFTLKLKRIYKATCNLRDLPMEYEWKSHAINSKKFDI